MTEQDYADAIYFALDALNAAMSKAVMDGNLVVRVDSRTETMWQTAGRYQNEIPRVDVRVQRDLEWRKQPEAPAPTIAPPPPPSHTSPLRKPAFPANMDAGR